MCGPHVDYLPCIASHLFNVFNGAVMSDHAGMHTSSLPQGLVITPCILAYFCCFCPIVATLTISALKVLGETNFTLSSNISGTTDAIQWFFTPASGPEQEIFPTEHYVFSPDRLTLTVITVTLADEGTYTIRASNIAGSDSDNVSITVFCK